MTSELDSYCHAPHERLRLLEIAQKEAREVAKLYPDASLEKGRWHSRSVNWEECDCAILVPDSYSDESAPIYYGKKLPSGVVVYMTGSARRYPLNIESKETIEALRSYVRNR